MTCGRCKSRPASVQVEGQINGRDVRMGLCADCALSAGLPVAAGPAIAFPPLSPAFGDLLNLLSHWSASGIPGRSPVRAACPVCRWTLAQFRKTGKMGCPDCYGFFHIESRDVLEKLHHDLAYAGKKPVRSAPDPLDRLRRELTAAVDNEDFELAAQIRDRIRAQYGASADQ